MKDDILRTDELDNAIDYLEKASYNFNNREDTHWFKWLMISLHGALYGFGICAIKGTDPVNRVIRKPDKKDIPDLINKTKKEYLEQFGMEIDEDFAERVFRYHEMNLLSILAVVVRRCQNKSFMIQNTESKVLKLTEKQNLAINKLNDYRNDFSHFKPKGLSVITQSEEWIIKEVVSVIEFLALESGNVFYRGLHSKEDVEKLIKEFNF